MTRLSSRSSATTGSNHRAAASLLLPLCHRRRAGFLSILLVISSLISLCCCLQVAASSSSSSETSIDVDTTAKDATPTVASSTSPISCPLGFGGRDATTLQIIPPLHINDNYCDCPTTGADEPLTNACAGFEHWSGLGDWTTHQDEEVEPILFQCPEQPTLKLSLSKLKDGICDCCSGVDEIEGLCDNICEQVLAAERAQRRALQESYTKGSQLRHQALQDFIQKENEVRKQMAEKQSALVQLEQQLRQTHDKLQQWKLQYWRQRRTQVTETARHLTTMATGTSKINNKHSHSVQGLVLLEPLTTDELIWWIIHACQLAGEIQGVPDHVKTCLPLRLAALDRGILWKHLSYELVRVAEPLAVSSPPEVAPASELEWLVAELLHYNSHNPDSASIYNEHGWKKQQPPKQQDDPASSSKAGRRRSNRYKNEFNDDEVPSYSTDEEEDEENDDDYSYNYDGSDSELQHRHSASRINKSKSKKNHAAAEGSDELWSDSRDNGDEEPAEAAVVVKKVVDSKPIVQLIKQQSLSQSRNAFLEQSSPLVNKMQAILDDIQKKEEDERQAQQEKRRLEMEERRKKRKEATNKGNGDNQIADQSKEAETVAAVSEAVTAEAPGNATETSPEVPSFDPIALPLARDKLNGLSSRVQQGFQYAVSAKILLDILVESHETPVKDENLLREELYQLAVGTIAHGKLSVLQVWQIYLHVLPELMGGSHKTVESSTANSQTCQSTWSSSCPPRTVDRSLPDGSVLSLPSKTILQAAEAFCKQQYELSTAGAAACASLAVPSDDAYIPSDIPDGFLGYHQVQSRGDDDPLHQALQGLTLQFHDDSRKELEAVEGEETKHKSDKKDLQRDMSALKESIGLDKPGKFGPDGELFALKDQCFSHDTGKYVYEVCLFGTAKQKEGKNSGGTNLGSWAEATIDEETGQRVWKWLNGNRCWNGPNRSATAYISCGTAARILSVEEPEMCKYELQMESYIACDEDFRKQNDLE